MMSKRAAGRVARRVRNKVAARTKRMGRRQIRKLYILKTAQVAYRAARNMKRRPRRSRRRMMRSRRRRY